VRATASPWQIRLPTEWEWQWAAQGGVLKRPYPWGGWLPNRANTTETEIAQTTAVGMFPAGTSAFGVDDLAGNLWEWCLNDYQSLEINLKQASWKSTRGGAMSCDQYAAACTYRAYNQPRFQWFDHGIRLVYGPPLDVE
jgi:formylglycine-generating enzyme required for sulfatase activity